MTIPQSVWSRVDRSGNCWVWVGGLSRGYGRFQLNGRKGPRVLAHRLVWEELCGPVPRGFELDHLCRNKRCVNPSHLEVVTHRENVLRGDGLAAREAKQTHCKWGHPFDGENTVIRQGKRYCRACQYIRNHRR